MERRQEDGTVARRWNGGKEMGRWQGDGTVAGRWDGNKEMGRR